MRQKVCYISLLIIIVLSLFACHAVPPEGSGNSPTTTPSTAPSTAPATTTTSVPTEPAKPKELVSQRLDHMWLYFPTIERYPLTNALIKIFPVLDPDLYPGMAITFDLSVNYGNIWNIRQHEWDVDYAELSIPNQTDGLRWRLSNTSKYEPIPEGEAVFVEAVVRADGNIVGYGILEIGSDHQDYSTNCAMMRTEGVYFPMIDGELQEVSEEYVADKIAELKQTVTPFDLEAQRAEFMRWKEEEQEWWMEWVKKMLL